MRRLAPITLLALATLALSGCIMPPPLPGADTQGSGSDASQGSDASPDQGASAWPRNMASYGVIFTADGVLETPAATAQRAAVEVDAPHAILYVDFQCPHCGTFEAANGDDLGEAVAAGEIALEVRPLTFLDRGALDGASTLAANAFAAVVDEFPETAWAFYRGVFLLQSTGEPLTADALIELAATVGAQSEQLSERIRGVQFRAFTDAANEAGLSEPVVAGVPAPQGTPAFYLDGQQYDGPIDQPGAVAAFLDEQR